jgi:ferrous iron transport protein B
MQDGWLKDLVVDGIIGGVGSVLVFLPNILLLYLFISLLEDSGYMARAAFIMDRLMHKIGLHGKSFIPMIMGFGCNVPAVMATRTIENRKSRLITMLIIPLMSCAGRMPVYILIAGAFFPKNASLVLLGLYALGILLAIMAAKIMSAFFKEDDLPFVMELPPYRVPTAKSIFRHTWEKGRQYLQKMSGIILVCSMIIWFLGYFPNHNAYESVKEQQEHSFIGYIGKSMEPVLKPLGFDWRMGVGIVSGVAAKELVVSTLGVMYADEEPVVTTGEESVAESGVVAGAIPEASSSESGADTRLQRALLKSVTPAGALAYMVFILLYFPCIATFVAIKQEGGGWKWAILTAVYTIILAWVAAFITFNIASIFI